MFREPPRKVTWFGKSLEAAEPHFRNRAAFAVLVAAVDRCIQEDVRTFETFDALNFLAERATRAGPFKAFRTALDMTDPASRWYNVNAALTGIRRNIGLDNWRGEQRF